MVDFDSGEFLKYVAAMFALLNPIGMVPLVLVFSAGGSARQRRHLVAIASLTVFVTLTVVSLFGEWFLHLFAISPSVFRAAGGVIVCLTALNMVRASGGPETGPIEKPPHNPAIVPLGIPLLAGPGAISAQIAFAHYPRPHPSLWISHALGLLVVSLATFACLLAATPLERLLGPTGLRIVTQVMGLILLSVGLEMVLHGLAGHLGIQLPPD
jgi:multiple antibiotic resistance protein